MFRLLFALFIFVPLIEIYVLIEVGGKVGAGWTVFAILATAIIGASLLRIQGASTLLRAQANIAQGNMPAMEVMEGIALAASGMMLLTPGFVTDSMGFLLLIPFLRRALIKNMLLRKQSTMQSGFRTSQHYSDNSHTVDGEVVDNDDKYIR